MAKARLDSDGSMGSDGPGSKEVNYFENTVTSKESSDPNATLELNEANSIEYTAYSWSNRKKWAVLTVVALCQTSMSKFKSKHQRWITLCGYS
jgi:hypothetical protein